MPAPRASRLQLGDNWPVLVFVGLLAVLIGLKGRFTGFDAHSLMFDAHVVPIKPAAHAHTYDATPSVHAPPLTHVVSSQVPSIDWHCTPM